MSVDIDWAKITDGPAGEALAIRIRDFIDDRFQAMALPRFIKSVKVHSFEFGNTPPEVEIKDITDPLADFYEDNSEADEADREDDVDVDEAAEAVPPAQKKRRERSYVSGRRAGSSSPGSSRKGSRKAISRAGNRGLEGGGGAGEGVGGGRGEMLTSAYTGIPGGTSNLNHHYHLHPHHHWTGAQTPFSAVTGHAHPAFASTAAPAAGSGRPPPSVSVPKRRLAHSRQPSHSSVGSGDGGVVPLVSGLKAPPLAPAPPGAIPKALKTKGSVSTFAAAPSSTAGSTRPLTCDALRDALGASTSAPSSRPAVSSGGSSSSSESGANYGPEGGRAEEGAEHPHGYGDGSYGSSGSGHLGREPRVEDTQAVFRIQYAGDIRLALTAELLLDYPHARLCGHPRAPQHHRPDIRRHRCGG